METPEEPRDPCWHWRGNLSFWPQIQMRTLALAATAEESREASCNSHGDWTFLRPHKRVPEVPIVTQEEPHICCHNSRKTRRFSPQYEMRPFSAAAFREKSHIHSSDSKASLTSLRQLKKFPGYPSPLERNTEVPATSRRPPFSPPHSELGVPFPASSGKESRNSRRTSRGGGLNLKFEKNSRVRATISKDPDVQVHSRYT